MAAADCGLGAQARLLEQWNGGFRFEVTATTWIGGTPFTFDWGGAAVSVRTAYSADVISQSGGVSVLALKSRWNDHHGFSFNADGAFHTSRQSNPNAAFSDRNLTVRLFFRRLRTTARHLLSQIPAAAAARRAVAGMHQHCWPRLLSS